MAGREIDAPPPPVGSAKGDIYRQLNQAPSHQCPKTSHPTPTATTKKTFGCFGMAELIPCFRVDKPKKKITGDKPDDILVPEWCDWKLPLGDYGGWKSEVLIRSMASKHQITTQ